MAEDLYLVTERELQSATVNAAGELEFTRENGQKINAGPVRGPKGDKGDRGDKGLDGANVLPTSVAVAQAITEPGPARDQLSATFVAYSKAKADGTDQTAVVQAELDALHARGGGVLEISASGFGPSVGVKVKNLTMPNNGEALMKQAPIIIRGAGPHWSGRGTAPVGATILEFTQAQEYGLIRTRGLGLLKLENITLRNRDTTINTPFVYTTNTTLLINNVSFVGAKTGINCDQDAIVLGGTQQIESQSGWDHGFQGYGTVISGNFFSGVRTAVKGQAFANAVVVRDNTVWTTCGNPNGAPIEWNGRPTTGTQWAAGCVIEGNLLELPNYKYAVTLAWCAGFTVAANNLFDSTATTTAGYLVASGCEGNVIHEGYTPGGLPVIQDSGTGTWLYPRSQGQYATLPPAKFLDTNYPTIFNRLRVTPSDSAFEVQPRTPADTAKMIRFIRSADHATAASSLVFEILQRGSMVVQGPQAGNITFRDEAGADVSRFDGSGRNWRAAGTGGPMTWDTGTSGSAATIKAYRVNVVDQTGARKLALCTTTPTDASLANGELGIFFDATTGAVQFKGKKSDGAVVSGTVALA